MEPHLDGGGHRDGATNAGEGVVSCRAGPGFRVRARLQGHMFHAEDIAIEMESHVDGGGHRDGASDAGEGAEGYLEG